MKRLDEGKVSLVDFLRSIKFTHTGNARRGGECPTHFAAFDPRTRNGFQPNTEDAQLIRSAN